MKRCWVGRACRLQNYHLAEYGWLQSISPNGPVSCAQPTEVSPRYCQHTEGARVGAPERSTMPYDSVVALGGGHPQTITGVAPPRARDLPTQRFRPRLAGESIAYPVPTDEYLGPVAERVYGRHQLRWVKIQGGCISVHPAWQRTALAEAIGPDGMLDINRIAPKVLCSLPRNQRIALMEMLASVRVRIAWCDDAGHVYRRHSILAMPIGKRWQVNGATALTLRMAANSDRCAFLCTLRDGLIYTVGELQGPEDGRIFGAQDVAEIILSTIDDVIHGLDPAQVTAQLAAAASLIGHGLRQSSKQAPNALHESMRILLQLLGDKIPHDPTHIGLTMGLVLAGGLSYAGSMTAFDYHKRWRVASLANLAWAVQNFIPLPTVSGASASLIVGSAIWWDFLHPQRDFSDLVARFQAELMLMAKWERLNLSEDETSKMFDWVTLVMRACGHSM